MLPARLHTVWRWLQYPLLLGLLAWLMHTARPTLVALSSHSIRWDWLLAGLVALQASVFLFAERYRIVLRASGIVRSYRKVLASYIQSLIYFFVTPGGIGVEIVRFVRLRDAPEGRADGGVLLSSLLIDRMLGMLSAVIVGIYGLGYIVQWLIQIKAQIYLLLFAGLTATSIIAFGIGYWQRARVIGLATKLWASYRQRKSILLLALCYSVAIQMLIGSAVFLCGHAIDIPIDIMTAIWVTSASMVLLIVPVSAGGFGLNDAGAALLFVLAGVPLADATALALLNYVLRLWLGLQSGVLEFASKIVKTRHG